MKNVLAVNTLRNHAALILAKRLFSVGTAAGILLMAGSILFPAQAVAQTVSVGTVSGLAGTAVDLAVSFTAGASGVATLQFDLALPASLSPVSTATGTAATNAGKSASGSSIAGGVRILLFGLNQNIIGSGQIAIVRLNIADGTSPGAQAVTIANIVASDALGGNVSASGTNGSVTVTAPADITPPVITSVGASGITQSSATISWTTDEAADSQVDYGTTAAYGSSTALNSSLVLSHSQGLGGLAAGTLYHYRVRSKDAAGNQALSGDYSFTTQAAVDITPPQISGVSSSVTSTSATISWTTNEAADSQVDYGTTVAYGSSTGLNSSLVLLHSHGLSGLTASTLYHYRVRSKDGSGNATVTGDFTFTTQAGSDIIPPVISGVMPLNITAGSATIVWSTDEASDSQVEYGAGPYYGSATPLNVVTTTYHAQTLSGLTANTLYHYRVKSRDAAGNLATSSDYSFTTAAATDTTPPVISGVSSSNATATSVTISWTTNEAADTQVAYGITNSYGSVSSLNTQLTTSHSQTLSGLASDTLYHYRVQSRNNAGNLGVSQDYSFTTLVSYVTTLFYPRVLTTSSGQQDPQDPEFLGFGIANLDSQPATLRFTAYNSAGAPLSGTGITNPVTRVLQPGAQLPIANSDYDLFGAGLTGTDSSGWVKVESTVSRVAGFFLMFDGQLTELDGVDMADTPLTSFVFSQIKNGGFNRINISNPNGDPATLTFNLIGADGTLQASASRDIPAYGALVADLANDIFPGFAADPANYVKASSTRSVLPLELLGKPSQDIESLRGHDATAGSSVLYCPQYLVGGMWRSALSIVNLDSAPAGVALRFIGDDASQIGATKVLQIAPYGKILVDDPAFFQQPADSQAVSSGYVEITSSGLFGSGIRMTGSIAFGDGAGNLETALPLNTSLDQSIVFSHVSSNNQYFTGVALVNPNYADAHLTVALYNEDGTLALTTNLTIPARHRISQLLTQIFPALAGQQRVSGYFRVTSDIGVAGFAAFGTNGLSLLSAIPAQIVR